MSYLIVFSLPETSHLGWMVGVMLLVTGGIALAIPVQGGFGTYHTLISVMLSLYAVDPTTGIFLATLLHTSQVVAVAVFGSLALLLAFVFKPKAIEERPTTD
jgi:glycosyltransferase 2 family protein